MPTAGQTSAADLRLRRVPSWLIAAVVCAAVAAGTLGPSLIGVEVVPPVDLLAYQAPWAPEQGNPPPARLPWAGDIVDALYPQVRWAFETIRSGTMPLWNPAILGGVPVATLVQNQVFYPVNLVQWVVGQPLGFALAAALRLFLAGFLTWGWLRAEGRGQLAAIIGGLSYMLATSQLAWLMWPHSNVAVMVPGVLWAVCALGCRPGLLPVAGVALAAGVMWLGGFPGLAFGAMTIAGLYGCLIASEGRWRRVVPGLLTGLLLGGLLAAFQLLPLAEAFTVVGFGERRVPDLRLDVGAFPWAWLATFLNPHFFGPPAGAPQLGPFPFPEAAGFFGVFAATGALTAVLAGPRAIGRRGWFWVAVIAFVAVATYQTRLGSLEVAFNQRLFFVAGLGLVWLATLLLERAPELPWRRVAGAATATVLIAGVGLALAAVQQHLFFLGCELFPGSPPNLASLQYQGVHAARSMLVILTALGLVVAVARWPFRTILPVALTVVVLVDLVSFVPAIRPGAPSASYYPTTVSVRDLQSQVGSGRILPLDNVFLQGSATVYGLPTLAGHDLAVTRHMGALLASLNPAVADRCLGTVVGFDRFAVLPLSPDWLRELGVAAVVDDPRAVPRANQQVLAVARQGGGRTEPLRAEAPIRQAVAVPAGAEQVCLQIADMPPQRPPVFVDLLAGDRTLGSGPMRFSDELRGGWRCADLGPTPDAADALQVRSGDDVPGLRFSTGPDGQLALLATRRNPAMPEAQRQPDLWVYAIDGQRAAVVPADRVEVIPDDRQAVGRLQDCAPGCAVTASPLQPGAAPARQADVSIVSEGSNAVSLRVRTDGDALVVLRDAWYPGWTARIAQTQAEPGSPAPIVRANVGFRGVQVGTGDWLVRFEFAPPAFYWSALVSGITAIMILSLIIAGVVRRRTP